MEKNNVLKNFLFSIGKVWKVDKIYIIVSVLLNIISAISVYTYSYTLKVAIDAIENKLPIEVFIRNVLVMIIISLALNVVSLIFNNYFWVATSEVVVKFNKEFSMKSLKIDYELYERSDIQDEEQKARRGIAYNGIVGMVTDGFMIVKSVIKIIIALAIISQVSIILILIILGSSVLKYFIETYREKKRKTDYIDHLPKLNRKISYANNISKNLSIGKDLRIYNMNKFIEKERESVVNEYTQIYKKYLVKETIINLFRQVLSLIDELCLYGFMIYEVLFNAMSIATFTFMISSVRRLTNAISSLIISYSRVVSDSLRVNDYHKFYSNDLFIDYEIKEFDEEFKSIEFKNVSYSYYCQEGVALDNVSFKINKGEKVALVGYNGAGKTTLIKLICGLYHPVEGEILINGINIERFDRAILSKYISPVFQDTVNYSIDVEENVVLRSTIDSSRVDYVLEEVGLTQKIDSLPNKKRTIMSRDIDEKGIELSGGESQKLSLARAIYKSSPLLILDEPTSAMDPLSEYNLYNNINRIIEDNAAIFISHRLSSTRFCDRIILLDNGKIIETGTHDELMNLNGEYSKLFNMQAEYYKGGDEDDEKNKK